MELSDAKFGRDHLQTVKAVANLGYNYKMTGELEVAIPLLEEAYGSVEGHLELDWVAHQLIDAYLGKEENDKAGKLLLEQVPPARKRLPKASPQLGSFLAQVAMQLLQAKKWVEAEPLIRECLAIRTKTQPDSWTTFNAQSMLGGSLLGQKKYAEAEPLLIAGYNGMKKQ